MTRRTRRILYITFILIFLVIAPLLLIHTAGYRYDWARKRLIRTGVMNLSSIPKSGSIFINGEDTNKKTPRIISNLLPGEYNVEIKKDGYLPWQNNIQINDNEATTILDIVLFRDIPSQLVVNEKIVQVELVPNSDNLILVTQDKSGEYLKKVNVINQETSSILETLSDIKIESPVSDNSLIVSYKNSEGEKIALINLNNNSETALDWLPQDITQIDILNYDTLLYIQNEKICRGSIANKESVCGLDKIDKFYHENDQVYFISQNSNTTYLYLLNDNPENSEILARLPYSEYYSFSASEKDSLIIIDQASNDLYLIEPSEPQSKIFSIKKAARDAFWLDTGTEVIYYDNFEIWLWDIDNDTQTVLTRVSQPIEQVVQYDSWPYLLFSQNNKINAISLEAFSNVRHQTTLIENYADWFQLDHQQEHIYYLGTGDNQIWQRSLR